MAKAPHELPVMGGNQHSGAQFIEFFKQIEQPHGNAVIDVAGRLIGQKKGRAPDDGARNCHALLLPTRQARWLRIDMVAQTDPFEKFGDVFANLQVFDTGNAQGQGHIFKGAKVIDQAEILKHHADSSPDRGQFIARNADIVAAKNIYFAPSLTQCQIQKTHQGRFAGTRRAGQKMKAAALEAKVQVAQNFRSGFVPDSDVPETDNFGQNRRST